MAKYNIHRRFASPMYIGVSPKVRSVMRMFGVTLERLRERSIEHKCNMDIKEGDVVYITGPSGAGKSVLLRELEAAVAGDEKINLNDIELPRGKAVIDFIDGDVLESLKLLGYAGLSDVFCVLKEPGLLSDGQKWRFRLACGLASGKKFIFADEYCCGLDRVSASVISYNIRKFARRNGVTFILASSHQDVLSDLRPDVLVLKELSGPAEVIYKGSLSGT